MLKIKPGVRLYGIRPETAVLINVVHSVFNNSGSHCVITSVSEGRHKRASKHYTGCAVDFRMKHFTGSKTKLVQDIREACGDDVDVIHEAEGGANEHLHVEYDPKLPY